MSTPFTRKSKYKAKPVMIDGIRFASQREGMHFVTLRTLERAGKIEQLDLQVPYELNAQGGEKVGEYRADFRYFDKEQKKMLVVDVKGFPTDLYKWKKRHMLAQYAIEIVEV